MKHKKMAALISQMNAKKRYEKWEGINVLVKPVPEGAEPGALDPRSYRFAKQLRILSRFLFRERPIDNPYMRILPYRKLFGLRKSRKNYVQGVRTSDVAFPSSDEYQISGKMYYSEVEKPAPILVYFHGGGFFGGGLHVVDQLCRQITSTARCIVLSVEYRLCPEYPYRSLLEDCWAATQWAFHNSGRFGTDPSRLIVAGDSAGGTLAAATALRDRDEQTGVVKGQVLLYPVVNAPGTHIALYRGADLHKYRIAPRHADILNATLKQMIDMIANMHDPAQLETVYLQGSISADSIYLAPLMDDLCNLPPTLLIYGEHDMLAAENTAYAKKALAAGAPCKTIIYEGTLHGFADQIGVLPQAEDCVQEIADWMHSIL